ncbi:MAG: atpG [Candidatus Saccharibacteria bacterium]|nr:atpG [Candidatus Saccharibacteria bacterium]
MVKVAAIKNDLNTIQQLSEMTKVLEETAARDIALMRERILSSRPYFVEAWKIYNVLQQLAPPGPQVLNKQLVVGITLDWGMTGSLLNRVVDKTEELYEEHGADLLLTGKMGASRFANRNERTTHFFNVPKKATYNDIQDVNKTISKYAHIHFVYPRFESLSKQTVAVASLSTKKEKDPNADMIDASRFVIEPNVQDVVDYMNEVTVGLVVYSYFSEALLAYSAAQMVSMRSAYDNAKEEHRRLNIRYNKARREVIDAKLRELYGNNTSGLKGGV